MQVCSAQVNKDQNLSGCVNFWPILHDQYLAMQYAQSDTFNAGLSALVVLKDEPQPGHLN